MIQSSNTPTLSDLEKMSNKMLLWCGACYFSVCKTRIICNYGYCGSFYRNLMFVALVHLFHAKNIKQED